MGKEKQKGSITVFLSFCLMSLISLILCSLELTRMNETRLLYQTALNKAADRIQSGYHQRLWQEYRILARETDTLTSLEAEAMETMGAYASLTNWYPMRTEKLTILQADHLQDREGEELEEEIASYMKYAAVADLLLKPEEGEQLLRNVTEAAKVRNLADSYGKEAKSLEALEKAVAALLDNIGLQEGEAGKTLEALLADEPGGFEDSADRYRKAVRAYPGLLEKCEKEYETLQRRRRDSQEDLQNAGPQLQEDREEQFEERWAVCEEYLRDMSVQMETFRKQGEILPENLKLLSDTESMVEDLVEEWENSEDEDGDREPLSLSSAANLWNGYKRTGVAYHREAGDAEKKRLLNRAGSLLEGNLLQLVWPKDRQISVAGIREAEIMSGTEAPFGPVREEAFNRLIMGAAGSVLRNEYCGSFFAHALQKMEHPLAYENEYLLCGREADAENLEGAVTKAFAVRSAWNLLYLMRSTEKQKEAEALALVITGAAGAAPLTKVVQYLILIIWAGGEGLEDLRCLLRGGRIPLWKTEEDWKLSLEGLLEMGRNGSPEEEVERSENGFPYGTYLKLLLLPVDSAVVRNRILQLLQKNIRVEEPGFRIGDCLTGFSITAEGRGRHLFFQLPFLERLRSGSKDYVLRASAMLHY